MNNDLLYWKILLKELNDFSSKIEFLQSAIRAKIIDIRVIDVSKYLESLKSIFSEHGNNLFLNPDKNKRGSFASPNFRRDVRDFNKTTQGNKVLFYSD
ncbi:MAG: hypothetical protein KJ571_07010 [Bacteroidetes bacterium]|nr:hypothetical protein [Bacteroidota bacterium]